MRTLLFLTLMAAVGGCSFINDVDELRALDGGGNDGSPSDSGPADSGADGEGVDASMGDAGPDGAADDAEPEDAGCMPPLLSDLEVMDITQSTMNPRQYVLRVAPQMCPVTYTVSDGMGEQNVTIPANETLGFFIPPRPYPLFDGPNFKVSRGAEEITSFPAPPTYEPIAHRTTPPPMPMPLFDISPGDRRAIDIDDLGAVYYSSSTTASTQHVYRWSGGMGATDLMEEGSLIDCGGPVVSDDGSLITCHRASGTSWFFAGDDPSDGNQFIGNEGDGIAYIRDVRVRSLTGNDLYYVVATSEGRTDEPFFDAYAEENGRDTTDLATTSEWALRIVRNIRPQNGLMDLAPAGDDGTGRVGFRRRSSGTGPERFHPASMATHDAGDQDLNCATADGPVLLSTNGNLFAFVGECGGAGSGLWVTTPTPTDPLLDATALLSADSQLNILAIADGTELHMVRRLPSTESVPLVSENVEQVRVSENGEWAVVAIKLDGNPTGDVRLVRVRVRP